MKMNKKLAMSGLATIIIPMILVCTCSRQTPATASRPNTESITRTFEEADVGVVGEEETTAMDRATPTVILQETIVQTVESVPEPVEEPQAVQPASASAPAAPSTQTAAVPVPPAPVSQHNRHFAEKVEIF